MGRIVVTEYISVDGVVEAPSGTEPFERVGWTDDFSRGPEGDKFKVEETMSCDALLLGRGTYDGFAPVWPHVEGEFADKFNSMPKYVVSSTLSDLTWNNSTWVAFDQIAALKDQPGGEIAVHGSISLVNGLLEADLIDELRLMVHPIVLGSGKRLFGEHADAHTLKLAEARALDSGSLILRYERA